MNGKTRSQHIRDWVKDHPNDSAKEVVHGLKGLGVTVRPALVYNLLSTERNKKRRGRKANGTANTQLDTLLLAKKLLLDAGSLQAAQAAIKVVAEIRGL